MPTYGYYCASCDQEMDIFQKITDSPITECPQCGKHSLRRGPGGGVGLQFKGAGFYINDYASGKSAAKKEEPVAKGSEPSCCPCGKATKCGS
jgi:putative FmdB family regulatory protein